MPILNADGASAIFAKEVFHGYRWAIGQTGRASICSTRRLLSTYEALRANEKNYRVRMTYDEGTREFMAVATS